MQKFQESNPSNARVYINYNNKEHPVRFSYPNKESAEKVVRRTINTLWMWLHFLELIILIFIFSIFSAFSNNFDSTLENYLYLSIFLIVSFIYVFLPPLLLTKVLVKDNYFMSRMPEINKKLALFPSGTHYYKCVKNLKSKVFELPYFNNIFLDYKATKDFSKYLERVEIIEYNFDVIKKRFWSKKKKHKQDMIWKARFYFKEIPKIGNLELFYE